MSHLHLLCGLSLPVQAASPAAAPLAIVSPGQGQGTTYAVLLGGWANGRWQPPNAFAPQVQRALAVSSAYDEGKAATVVEWSPTTGPRARLGAGCTA